MKSRFLLTAPLVALLLHFVLPPDLSTAADPATTPANPANTANAAPAGSGAAPADSEFTITSVEERRLLFSLRQERDRLADREKVLAQKEMELKTLEQEVDKKLNELKALREELTELLDRKTTEESGKIEELSKMYEKMEPAKAAAILVTLDEKIAIGLLGGMKKKAAASILDNMEKEKAASLSTAFSAGKTE
ncbi:MAG: hypothetical protein A2521_11265 [Deltaproteobacteria bacterium RIFOXYD12_FULL_57_12]|nr:MAG: hypothetical protein A2521_11265 [Deltaproteobacteria bacterium RIFOXYD12_FULL_57_12]